jgi:hypothetical protein
MRLVIALLMAAMLPLGAQRSFPSRGELAAAEQSMLEKLRKQSLSAPMDVLGLPRGIYLEGYGAVFTAEVNLAQTSGLSIFRPQLTKDEVAQLRLAKVRRVPEFKQLMKQMLVDSAATLDRVPAEEQVVVGVVMFFNRWEDRTGLPQMITVQARREELLKMATHPEQRAALERAIVVREE